MEQSSFISKGFDLLYEDPTTEILKSLYALFMVTQALFYGKEKRNLPPSAFVALFFK